MPNLQLLLCMDSTPSPVQNRRRQGVDRYLSRIKAHLAMPNDNQLVQTFEPDLTELQQQVLSLLKVPGRLYSGNQ